MEGTNREFAAAELFEGVDFPRDLLGVALLEFEVAEEEFVAVLLALFGFFAGEEGGDGEVAGGLEGCGGGVGGGEEVALFEDGGFGVFGPVEDAFAGGGDFGDLLFEFFLTEDSVLGLGGVPVEGGDLADW